MGVLLQALLLRLSSEGGSRHRRVAVGRETPVLTCSDRLERPPQFGSSALGWMAGYREPVLLLSHLSGLVPRAGKSLVARNVI